MIYPVTPSSKSIIGLCSLNVIKVYLSHFVQVFRPRTPPEAIELVSRLLEYTPCSRITPMEACAHSFFNELRHQGARMPNGREFPPLFNFTAQGECQDMYIWHTPVQLLVGVICCEYWWAICLYVCVQVCVWCLYMFVY